MVGVPWLLPVTTPVALTVAAPVELDHEPTKAVSVRVIVPPTQTLVGPEIAEGAAFTVTDAYTSGPQPFEKVIGAIPCAIPVTEPDNGLTVAIVVAPLVHVPPVAVSPKAILAPTHTRNEPVIAAGAPFTVIGYAAVVPQPVE